MKDSTPNMVLRPNVQTCVHLCEVSRRVKVHKPVTEPADGKICSQCGKAMGWSKLHRTHTSCLQPGAAAAPAQDRELDCSLLALSSIAVKTCIKKKGETLVCPRHFYVLLSSNYFKENWYAKISTWKVRTRVAGPAGKAVAECSWQHCVWQWKEKTRETGKSIYRDMAEQIIVYLHCGIFGNWGCQQT